MVGIQLFQQIITNRAYEIYRHTLIRHRLSAGAN